MNLGVVQGTIEANGLPFNGIKIANSLATSNSAKYAYVMQDDVHSPFFTVLETLQFAAMLRKRVVNQEEVEEEVRETLSIMGLTHVQDNLVGIIGNSMISRGQLRRLTIGVEIVNSPSVIFLDEPVRMMFVFSFHDLV